MAGTASQSAPSEPTGPSIDIGAAGDFVAQTPVFLQVGGRAVVVVRDDAGALHALIDRCSHQSRSMAGGRLARAHVLRCPHHGVCYDVRTGAVARDAGFLGLLALSRLTVTEHDGRVQLTEPPPGSSA